MRWGKVVPKNAPVVDVRSAWGEGEGRGMYGPSTPRKREEGGTYMSTQLGQ